MPPGIHINCSSSPCILAPLVLWMISYVLLAEKKNKINSGLKGVRRVSNQYIRLLIGVVYLSSNLSLIFQSYIWKVIIFFPLESFVVKYLVMNHDKVV